MKKHLSKEWWWLAHLRLKAFVQPKPTKRSTQLLIVTRELAARYDREELYQAAWQQPLRILAKTYGMSDVGLAKVCKKLFVPLPGRGYWAKKTAGQKMKPRPTLPSIEVR